MPSVAKWLEQRTELSRDQIEYLESVVAHWSILADLSLSDLVLWVPTWNEGGLVAVSQVRAATAPTSIAEDLTGVFSPRGRNFAIDKAAALNLSISERDPDQPLIPLGTEAYPVTFQGSTIAVLARYPSPSPRVAGQLEHVYLESADSLFSMVAHGIPWFSADENSLESWDRPRVGDGLIRLNSAGLVDYASPNATGSFRRLGLVTGLVGQNFRNLVSKLNESPTGVSKNLDQISRGGQTGHADIHGSEAIIMVFSIAMFRSPQDASGTDLGGIPHSTLVILKDVTSVRSHQRALLSKDATIREINHRVKNNLQMVNSILRLQRRRAHHEETREALHDAQQRINAIAAIHDILSRDVITVVNFDELVDSIIAVANDGELNDGELNDGELNDGELNDGEQGVQVHRRGVGGVLPTTIATPLAMSISELLHNSLEHSQADAITVEIQKEGPDLICAVVDNGIGFSAEPGLGLTIVSDLVTKELQGQFEIQAADPLGTKAQITLRMPRTPQR